MKKKSNENISIINSIIIISIIISIIIIIVIKLKDVSNNGNIVNHSKKKII